MQVIYAAVRPASIDKPWLGQNLRPFIIILRKGNSYVKVTGTWKIPDGPAAPYKEVEISSKEMKDVLETMKPFETCPKLATYLAKTNQWSLRLKPYPRRRLRDGEPKDVILSSQKINLTEKIALDSFIPYHLLTVDIKT